MLRAMIVTSATQAHKWDPMDTARYVFGVLIVTALPPGLLWWFLVHPFVGFWRGIGARGTLWSMTIVAVAGLVALKRKEHLTMRILVGIPELEPSGHGGTLLTEGIYAVIRHPRYVEIVLGTLAYSLFANYLGAYLLTAATIPILHLIVLLEERELRERFGEEYLAYTAAVPRYIPRRR